MGFLHIAVRVKSWRAPSGLDGLIVQFVMLASGIVVIADEQSEARRADHLLLLPRQRGGVLRHGGDQQDQAKARHDASFPRQMGLPFPLRCLCGIWETVPTGQKKHHAPAQGSRRLGRGPLNCQGRRLLKSKGSSLIKRAARHTNCYARQLVWMRLIRKVPVRLEVYCPIRTACS